MMWARMQGAALRAILVAGGGGADQIGVMLEVCDQEQGAIKSRLLIMVEGRRARVQERRPVHKSEQAARPIRARVHFSIQEQLRKRNVMLFQGGLVFEAHRLLYHSTLGSGTRGRHSTLSRWRDAGYLEMCDYGLG